MKFTKTAEKVKFTKTAKSEVYKNLRKFLEIYKNYKTEVYKNHRKSEVYKNRIFFWNLQIYKGELYKNRATPFNVFAV